MEPNGTLRQVLIVDSDARMVAEIARVLREFHTFQVHAFTSGLAARRALEQSKFDLLVTDWKLPDIDGLTLIREAEEYSPYTVTVLMSALESPECEFAARQSIVDYLIQKPFAIDKLIGVITSVFPTERIPDRPPKPQVLKVVLGGDAQVGKTSLIQRYCTGRFEPARSMTIGVDFHVYDLRVDESATRMIVWDMGGQERFTFARRAFYRGARAVGLVFDASNRASFYNLARWWRETRENLKDVPLLLLANKTDLPRQVSCDETIQLAQAWGVPLFSSSCASGEGVSEFFEALAYYAAKNAARMRVPEMPVGK